MPANDEHSSSPYAAAVTAMGVQQVLVINLRRRPDRRAFMEKQLHQLPKHVHSEFVQACDGFDGEAAAWWSGRPVRPGATAKATAVAACQASWELALFIALQRNRFPALITEDDIDLRPAFNLGERPYLPVPHDADAVALANGPNLAARGLASDTWLTKSTVAIREIAHSSGAMLLPNAAGCRKMLSFLKSRPTVWYIDRVMQHDFVESNEARGVVYHAIPSLLGWVESVSDVEGADGASWVRPASHAGTRTSCAA